MKAVRKFLKRYLPKSLFGRALLILLVPILVLHSVIAVLIAQRYYDAVTEQMVTAVAREVDYAIARIEELPSAAEAREALVGMSAQFDMEMGLDEGGKVDRGSIRAFYDFTGGVIADTLKHVVRRPMSIDLLNMRKYADARIVTTKGVLRVLIPRRRMNPSNPHQLFIWMTLTAILLAVVAVMFLRNEIRPINELARAAAAFGRGRAVPFRPSGAIEVRAAGAAFIDMRARIERQIEQRTSMLSGVSHDLRTPLTRMKLALAVSDDSPEVAEIGRDVDEMEHMLNGFLDFARGEGGEMAEPADPTELAEEVTADARRKGIEITLYSQVETPADRTMVMRRRALKRCLTNLVDNAATYGDRVALSLRMARKVLEFAVEDDGPGIPPEKREEVLKPFTRLDESRNQNVAPGVGLGLSIAQDIARTHGGTLQLDESPRLGGLRATVVLPR